MGEPQDVQIPETKKREFKRKDLSAKLKTTFDLIIKCENESDQEQTYNRLREVGIECYTST